MAAAGAAKEEQEQEQEQEPAVEIDAWPAFRKYRDGTVERFTFSATVEPSPDSYHGGVRSRDVTVDAGAGVFVRMFLPETRSQENRRLPILLFFHGGFFCLRSATDAAHHRLAADIAVAAQVLCVSVEYRMAPENRLPAACDDCFAALWWLLAGPGRADDWVSGAGDAGRVFLGGISAGGNIVHEVGLRAGRADWPADVRFSGAVLLHPFFHDPALVGKPPQETGGFPYAVIVSACVPQDETAEEYAPLNPGGPRSAPADEVVFGRALVAVAEKDYLRTAGERYARQLLEAGLEVEVAFNAGKVHGFFVMENGSPEAVALIQRVADFLGA